MFVDSEESFVGSFGRKRIEYTGIGLKGVTVSFAKAPVDGNLSAVARTADSIVAQWTGSAQTPARLVTLLENDLYTALLAAANTSDIVDVNKTLRALQPTEQANTVVASSQAAVNHMSAMLSCGVAEGNFASVREGECAWASPTGSIVRNFEDRATYRDFGFVIGKQSALNDRWRAGIGVGYDYTTTRSPDVTRQGYRLHVGGALKYSSGPWLAALAASAAYDWGDAVRRIDLPTGLRTARSDRSAGVLASRLRLARLFELGGIDLTPRVDFDATFIHDFGYSERDAGIWSVKTQASNSVLFDVHPALRLSSDFALGGANIVRPYLESGLRLNTTFGKSSVSFNPDTILAGATTVDHKRERRVATFGGGLSIFHDNRYELKMTYTGSFSRNSSGHTGMLKFASQF